MLGRLKDVGGDLMSEGAISIKKAIPIIVITWILSLVATLAVVYVAPNVFPYSVKTANIADSAIITAKLADGNVTSAKILDGTLTAVDMADGSIITVKVADGAVTTDKIADGAVTAANIANGAIVTVKLADGSVTSAKIVDGTVKAVDLANNAIITAKISNGAITTAKIADEAVTTSKIADSNITNIKLAAGAIPYNVTNFDYADGFITTTSTSWVNMTGTSVDITLTRNSTLLIMFSAMGRVDSAPEYMYWHAMVNSTEAYPTSFYNIITQIDTYATYTCNFYGDFTAGNYTVYIQWKTWTGSTVRVRERTLFVIALPA
jgi:hypothetical protein